MESKISVRKIEWVKEGKPEEIGGVWVSSTTKEQWKVGAELSRAEQMRRVEIKEEGEGEGR